MKKNKNCFVELLRFIFCMMIFMHHSGFFGGESEFLFKYGGAHAVEFFFILTGALAAGHLEKNMPKTEGMKYSMGYTVGKLKRVFPYAAVGIILSYIAGFLSANPALTLKEKLFGRWNIVYECLFLPMTGVMNVSLESFLNTPLWYLSVILIVLPVVLYLAIRKKDLFDNYLCIILPLLIHGYIINKYTGIALWSNFSVLVYVAVLRGLADIMLGFFVYNLSKRISEADKVPGYVWSVLEIALYLFSLYTFTTNVDGYTFEFAVLCMAAAMAVTFSQRTITSKVKGSFFEHLGKISLPIYCIHWPIYTFVSFYGKGLSYAKGVGITLVLCIAVSELLLLIMRCIKKNDTGVIK